MSARSRASSLGRLCFLASAKGCFQTLAGLVGLVEILGLPVAAGACSARPHDVVAARELLRDRLPDLARLRAIVGDRAYRGLARLAERKHVALDIKAPPAGRSGFTPLWPLYKVEHTITAPR